MGDDKTRDIHSSLDPDEPTTFTERSEFVGPKSTLGPYRLLQKLGEGGMGEVWEAEQTEPVRRKVALKVIKAGMDTSRVIARFEAERQALAMMDHPTIAKVFEAGQTPRGRPYFAMEYVQGVPITEYCDRNKLSTRERLELFVRVCAGVQHAHQKAIIHRDLKPSNVLVALEDGKPVPKIIDFGVAKATAQPLTEKTLFTQLGQLVGTPAYMSPEQAEMSAQNVDTRTDIYSLGVLLYELLVGALPFDPRELLSAGYAEIVRRIVEHEPPRPSTRLSTLGEHSGVAAKNRSSDPARLRGQLQGDLDWIVMKAMDKDRTRRYETSNGLAMDVLRYLQDEPVLARPPSAGYRVRKWMRRHRTFAAFAATLTVLLIGFGVAMSALYVQARRAEAEALIARDESQSVTNFLADMLAAVDPTEQGLDVTVRQVLDEASEKISDEFADKPRIDAKLRHTIGATYDALGDYDAAEKQLPAALGTRRELLGEDHPDTLDSKSQLGTLYVNQGRPDEALKLKLEVYEKRLAALGDEDEETLAALNDLGLVYIQLDRLQDAESLLTRGLEASRRALSRDHEVTLHLMNALSNLYWQQRRREEMTELNVEIVKSSKRVLGEDHPSTLTATHNLATSYFFLASDHFHANRYEEADRAHAQAEAMYLEVIEKSKRVRGPEHRSTLTPMYMLAITYGNQGRNDEAEQLMLEVHEIRMRTLGPDHPDTLGSASQLGRLCIKRRAWREAEALLSDATARAARTQGEEHSRTATLRYRLGIAWFELGRPDAERILEQSYATFEKLHGRDYIWCWRVAVVLGDLCERQGRAEDAAAWRARVDPEFAAGVEANRKNLGIPYD